MLRTSKRLAQVSGQKNKVRQYSQTGLKSFLYMDRGAWKATVHGVARVGHDLRD